MVKSKLMSVQRQRNTHVTAWGAEPPVRDELAAALEVAEPDLESLPVLDETSVLVVVSVLVPVVVIVAVVSLELIVQVRSAFNLP